MQVVHKSPLPAVKKYKKKHTPNNNDILQTCQPLTQKNLEFS